MTTGRKKMKEKGRIIEKKGKVVVVEIEKEDRKGCASCGLCKIWRKPYIEIESEEDFDIGDEVIIEVSEDIILKFSFFIYGLPLAGFIAGILIGGIIKNQMIKIITFFIILGLSWSLGFKLANRLGRKYKPQIKLFRK